ncbi:MAG: serine/threonine-protein kinase PknK, partial [Desulfobacterales bacterium]|nr:serine/threonine-protein kinase PknK [Desulfobacterales bacterium]
METIRDYSIVEKSHQRFKSIFYNAHNINHPETAVTIELIDATHATPSEIARIKHEYKKIKTLDEQHIIHTYDIFDHNNSIAIVTEAFAFHPFYRKFIPGETDIDTFLQLAVTLTRTLGYIHSQGIVHQSVTPDAILYDNATDLIKIGSFGASGLITRIHEETYGPLVVKDVLPYMAPEQTGRMNCSVDHRADLYALGIIFYELLTGSVPFSSDDPIEIIHAHIALQPPAPADILPAVPEAVSNLVMKLLSKTVENRYQSAYGAMADFTNCVRLLEKNNHIPAFDLGSRDIVPGLQIPEKLFGRETETEVLMAAFERAAAGGNELLMVKGRPGIGKTSLINEIQKPVVAKRAYFICGKAEQYKRDIPYYPIIQTLDDLARKVLCEPDDQINEWKTGILKAIGAGSRLITDLVPEFQHIIGLQPDLTPLGTDAAHLRINYIFNKFLKVCATKNHPLVIFVDDLQWADTASLSFIRMLSSEPDIRHLLIIGAYRDNEVNDSHPLMRALDQAQKNNAQLNTISLPPLSLDNVKQMITDLLRDNETSSQEVSEIIHRKTSGNPFFIRQFLNTLYDEKALTLNPESGLVWDMERIADIRVTNNVVDFMAEKITALPAATREIIKVGACYGNRFHLADVAAIHGITLETAVAELTTAVDKGLIFFKADTGVFSHDRIREGVYQLFTKDERIQTHCQIGRFLLKNTPEKQLDDEIIDIANHFNIARELITSADEQIRVARLNRRTGEKAMASAAFDSAFHYFKTGIEFLATAAAGKKPAASYWQTDYDLSLALYNSCAEAAYLTTDFNEMHRLTEIIF